MIATTTRMEICVLRVPGVILGVVVGVVVCERNNYPSPDLMIWVPFLARGG